MPCQFPNCADGRGSVAPERQERPRLIMVPVERIELPTFGYKTKLYPLHNPSPPNSANL